MGTSFSSGQSQTASKTKAEDPTLLALNGLLPPSSSAGTSMVSTPEDKMAPISTLSVEIPKRPSSLAEMTSVLSLYSETQPVKVTSHALTEATLSTLPTLSSAPMETGSGLPVVMIRPSCNG